MKTVFITGGTGYIGIRLIRRLSGRGHRVLAFVRRGSERKVPARAEVIAGDPFDADDLCSAIPPGAVFVQLLGVPRPSPRKRDQFFQIDLRSARASATAAARAGAGHFIYLSVAQEPSKIMSDYQAVRAEAEDFIRGTGLPHTFVRPWYVVGPGHWWPLLFWPLFKLLEILPATRRKAKALALVSIGEVLNVLTAAVEHPENFGEILDVPDIRNGRTPLHMPFRRSFFPFG